MRVLLLSLSLMTAPAFAGQALTGAELSQRLQSGHPPQVLDVRTGDEFERGHVPGAMLVPHDELAANLARLDRSRPVVVYCRSGRRSGIAEALLRERGFDVSQLEGSWLAWREAGMPVACPPDGCAADFDEATR